MTRDWEFYSGGCFRCWINGAYIGISVGLPTSVVVFGDMALVSVLLFGSRSADYHSKSSSSDDHSNQRLSTLTGTPALKRKMVALVIVQLIILIPNVRHLSNVYVFQWEHNVQKIFFLGCWCIFY